MYTTSITLLVSCVYVCCEILDWGYAIILWVCIWGSESGLANWMRSPITVGISDANLDGHLSVEFVCEEEHDALRILPRDGVWETTWQVSAASFTTITNSKQWKISNYYTYINMNKEKNYGKTKGKHTTTPTKRTLPSSSPKEAEDHQISPCCVEVIDNLQSIDSKRSGLDARLWLKSYTENSRQYA